MTQSPKSATRGGLAAPGPNELTLPAKARPTFTNLPALRPPAAAILQNVSRKQQSNPMTPPPKQPRPSATTAETGDPTIRRTVHFKFMLPGANEALIAMIKSATPLYQMFGDATVRFLQNVDDPTRFLQQIEYDAPEAIELNRQQLAGDPRVQTYIQAWRAILPGAIEIEVYKDV
jgi:hypothetical protein